MSHDDADRDPTAELRAACAVLEVDPGTPEDQVRRAYKQLLHLFDPDSPVVYGLYTREEAAALVARIEAAWRTLNAAARHASVPPGALPAEGGPSSVLPAVISDPLAALDFPADAPLTGTTIARVRQLLGVRLEDIAERTKIGMFTLRCIEREAFGDLPAKVYLKGFLRQIAEILRIDAERLGRDYLSAYEAWHRHNR